MGGGGAQKVSDPRLLASPLCRESVHEKIKLASFAVMMMIAGVNVPFKKYFTYISAQATWFLTVLSIIESKGVK